MAHSALVPPQQKICTITMVKLHAWQDRKDSFSVLDKNIASKIFLKFIKNGDNLLDIGCGDCGFFDFIKKHRQCEFHAFDMNEDALKIAKEKGYSAHKFLDASGQFDVISMVDVFEHLTIDERIEIVKKIDGMLLPGGYVLMTFPHVKSFLSVANYFDNIEHKAPYVKVDGVMRLFETYSLLIKKPFSPWLSPFKIISCIATGLSIDSIYNSMCLVLQKPLIGK